MPRPCAVTPGGSLASCPIRASLAFACRPAPALLHRQRSISLAWMASARRSIQPANRRPQSPATRASGVSSQSRSAPLLPAPHLPCRLHHALELALLLVRTQQIADHIRGEAALRADRKLLERQDLRGFIDAALERLDRL